jgi:hypothetical protein
MGTASLAITVAIMAAVPLFLVGAMVWSIRTEKRRARLTKTWKYFGLSIALSILFFLSWIGQGLSEWRLFVEEQRAHEEPARAMDYVAHLAQSTMENWQSEFLQLFSFVVLAAFLVHRGSAESRDSDDRIEEAIGRIERRLDEIADGSSS